MGNPTTDHERGAADGLALEVSDFGPIVEAKVELRPLTVFVGPSNAGKSYLATLLYALHRFFGMRQFPFRVNADGSLTISPSRVPLAMSDAAVKGVFEFIRSVDDAASTPAGGRVSLSPGASDALRSGFAERAGVLADEINRCFGVAEAGDLVRAGKKAAHVTLGRRISDDVAPLAHALTIARRPELKIDVPAGTSIRVDHEPANLLGALDLLRSMPQEAEPLSQGLAWALLAAAVLPDGLGPLGFSAYYLPADRIGLMRAHGALVGALIARASTAGLPHRAPAPMLSGVTADFLEQLHGIDRLERKLDLGTDVERAILGGSLRMVRSPHTDHPEVVYRPVGWQKDLPLARASAMVSDIAPVVLYLRHLVKPGDVLIVEEAESHMHPAMQLAFTRQLAAVVNAGVRVIATTHSEWLTEELGNIVRRSALPESEREGPALDARQVGVWLFEAKRRPRGSVVREIPFDDYGYGSTGSTRWPRHCTTSGQAPRTASRTVRDRPAAGREGQARSALPSGKPGQARLQPDARRAAANASRRGPRQRLRAR